VAIHEHTASSIGQIALLFCEPPIALGVFPATDVDVSIVALEVETLFSAENAVSGVIGRSIVEDCRGSRGAGFEVGFTCRTDWPRYVCIRRLLRSGAECLNLQSTFRQNLRLIANPVALQDFSCPL
jgi:hypothetical protein